MQIYQVLNLDVTKFSILMRSKFSGSHASLNIVTLCSEYVCTCHDMTLYGRVTLLVHTGERIRVWYGRVSHGIFTRAATHGTTRKRQKYTTWNRGMDT